MSFEDSNITGKNRPYVIYWNNIPSPYMIDRFNALSNRNNLRFEVIFNDRLQKDRSWSVEERTWKFSYSFSPSIYFLGYKLHIPFHVLKKKPDVIVSLYSKPSFIVGWMTAKLRGCKTCFRVLMTHDSWSSRHPIKEGLKRLLFKHVDAIETTGRDGKRYAMHYGTPEHRIHFATHTVNTEYYNHVRLLSKDERETLRYKLGIKGFSYIYVGRLWWGKGINYLLDAFRKVQNRLDKEVSLLLVGDGLEKRHLKQICAQRDIKNVIFTGFIQKEALPWLYMVSDVFVFPTLGDPYGIVVDEAMASSLPVISTSAVGEIKDRIDNGVNGFIVPPQNSTQLAERMLYLAKNTELSTHMGKLSQKIVRTHTPENWAMDFEGLINTILNRI